MDLYFALYRSKSKRPLDQKTVLDILNLSTRNNARDQVTGFLHTDQDHFLQYLEGPHDQVMRKLAKIQRDPRHHNFMILADGTIDERLFPDWTMGQIDELHHDDPGSADALAYMSWLKPNPDIDPLPLLSAFAAHALGAGQATITESA